MEPMISCRNWHNLDKKSNEKEKRHSMVFFKMEMKTQGCKCLRDDFELYIFKLDAVCHDHDIIQTA